MSVKEIVIAYLVEHGYDGLYSTAGECGCELADLCPCCDAIEDCEPGVRAPCDCGEHDWHVVPREEDP